MSSSRTCETAPRNHADDSANTSRGSIAHVYDGVGTHATSSSPGARPHSGQVESLARSPRSRLPSRDPQGRLARTANAKQSTTRRPHPHRDIPSKSGSQGQTALRGGQHRPGGNLAEAYTPIDLGSDDSHPIPPGSHTPPLHPSTTSESQWPCAPAFMATSADTVTVPGIHTRTQLAQPLFRRERGQAREGEGGPSHDRRASVGSEPRPGPPRVTGKVCPARARPPNPLSRPGRRSLRPG